ncbi:oligosaccharide flippase family protein [Salinirubellus sp. GCM10025818]|uniref:oligosaccharide flippase family protein n=1 Tax=Salinirubellus TaxID=2162630 RepID=UPI0030D271AE
MKIGKTTSDVLFSGVINVAIRLRGLVFIPLITISLGVDAFGAYTQILSIASLLELIFGLGLHAGLVRYGRRSVDTADLYYSLLVVASLSTLVVTAVVAVFAEQLATLTLGDAGYASAFRIGALLILIRTVFRSAQNYFRIDSRIKVFSAVEGIRAYGDITAVAISVYALGLGLDGLFTSMVLFEAAFLGVLQLQIVREVGITIPSFPDLRANLEYSVPVAISSLAGNVSSRVDRIMIGFFLGASAVGVYSIAYQIAVAMSMYVKPIEQTFFPEFSDFIDENRYEKCANYLRTGTRYFLIIAVPTAGGMFLIGPDVISILTAGQGTPSPYLVGVIALGITIGGIERLTGTILDAVEETALRAKIIWAGAVANILINAVLIPSFGIMGAAVATVLTFVLIAGLTIYRVADILPSTLPWLTVGRTVAATLVMIVVAETFVPDRIVITVVLSALLYFGALFASRELTLSELRTRLPIQR